MSRAGVLTTLGNDLPHSHTQRERERERERLCSSKILVNLGENFLQQNKEDDFLM